MDDSRLVEIVLRCYPARWRRRHGAEAAELAALLIRDGTPTGSIAWSYLAGAAREWLTPRVSRRLSTAACALLVAVASLGLSAGLLASAGPARAAITSQGSSVTRALGTGQARAGSSSQARATGTGRTSQARMECRPGSEAPGAGVIGVAGRPQVTSWEAGDDRSC